MTQYMLQHIIINESAVLDEKYQYMFSVEVVNDLVLQGVSFRDAYKQVGELIANGQFKPMTQVKHTHEGSIGNLCNNEIRILMDNALAAFAFDKVSQALNNLLTKQ